MSGRAEIGPDRLELPALSGRYRLVERLGRGGMAEVYLAHDEVLDRHVAVKMLLPELAADPSFRQRFRREARAAASLSHPNIVAVHDTGGEDDAPFIVMEYVRGRSLDALLSDSHVSRERALEICAEVCSALDYAHAHGIVHLDVKPGNILIADPQDPAARASDGGVTHDPSARPSGASPVTVKVADFGIARAAGSDTLTTASVLGTASYLSPEQARGEAVDGRSDLYSLGVVLYELTTGRVPFPGDSPLQVALRHVADPPPRPGELTEVDPALEAVILKALAKDPAKRHQSAHELRSELLALLEGAGGRAVRTARLPATTVPVWSALATDHVPVETAGVPSAGTSSLDATTDATEKPAPTGVAPGGPAARDSVRVPSRRRSRRSFYFALGVLALLGLAVALAGPLGQVTVPEVAGLAEEEALRRLDAEGLAPSVAARVSSLSVPAGHVISSDP
ncbi:MAG: protein kinase, partial [Actinomycetota bacterium]|nr:protein kinase [Actinomycetota bacterium]